MIFLQLFFDVLFHKRKDDLIFKNAFENTCFNPFLLVKSYFL